MSNTCKKNSSQVPILYKPTPVSYTTTIDKKFISLLFAGLSEGASA